MKSYLTTVLLIVAYDLSDRGAPLWLVLIAMTCAGLIAMRGEGRSDGPPKRGDGITASIAECYGCGAPYYVGDQPRCRCQVAPTP